MAYDSLLKMPLGENMIFGYKATLDNKHNVTHSLTYSHGIIFVNCEP